MRASAFIASSASVLCLACATGSQPAEPQPTATGSGSHASSSSSSASSAAGSASSTTSSAGTSGSTTSTASSGGASGSSGSASSGGAGGAAGFGGAAGAAGGTPGAGGTGAGTASSSSAGGGGAGGCAPGINTDGDGQDDCAELSDGDPWTDPAIFNGMRVRWAEQCNPSPSCAMIDTLAEVDACVASQPLKEQKDQVAGWDWNDSPDGICSVEYGFQPSWTLCSDPAAVRWQADWTGYIKFAQSGIHCFSVTGNSSGGCASLFWHVLTNGPTHDSGPRCYSSGANSYKIRWHYEMATGSTSDMHVNYCFGGSATCTPSAPIPATLLRVSP